MPNQQIGFGLGTFHTPSTLETVLDGLLTGIAAFGQAYGQRVAGQKQQQRAQLEHEAKMRSYAVQEGAANTAAGARRYAADKQAAASADRNQRMLRTAGMRTSDEQLNRDAAAARQKAAFDFQTGTLFPHQEKLRNMVPPGTTASVDATNERARLYRAESQMKQLQISGVLSPTMPDGSPNPNYQRDYQKYYEFFSMNPEEQATYLDEQEKADQEEADRVFNEQTIPDLHRQTVGILGQDPDVLKRMQTLQDSGQNSQTLQDIYGVGAQGIFGSAPNEVPTPFLNPPDAQGDVLRQDAAGKYKADLTPFKKAMEFLNRQSKSKRRPAAPSPPSRREPRYHPGAQ